MAGEKRWVDPRDSEDELSIATTGLGENLQNNMADLDDPADDLNPLPEISFAIECTNPFHEFPVWLHTIIVQYVRGQVDSPIFVKSKDLYRPLLRPLIRDQELFTNLESQDLEESKWFDLKYDQHLTQKGHDHLVRTNQWRDKVNLECKCGENIPFKSLEGFLSFVKIALDKGFDEEFGFLPLQFFHFPKPHPN